PHRPVALIPRVKFHPCSHRAPEIKLGLFRITGPSIDESSYIGGPGGTVGPIQGPSGPGSIAVEGSHAALRTGRWRWRVPGAGGGRRWAANAPAGNSGRRPSPPPPSP